MILTGAIQCIHQVIKAPSIWKARKETVKNNTSLKLPWEDALNQQQGKRKPGPGDTTPTLRHATKI